MKTAVVAAITAALGLAWGFAWRGRRKTVSPDKSENAPAPNSVPEGFPPTLARLLKRLHGCLKALRQHLAEHRQELKQTLPPLEETPVSTETVVAALVSLAETNQRLQDRLAAAELQLAQQSRELQAQWQEVRSDPLTGLPNRRVFDQELWRRISLFRNEGQTFALAIFDVDHFKDINDTFGHKVGDEVLCHVAQALRATAPQGSLLARIGGEEFALIWPHIKLAQTLDEAETVRKAVKAFTCKDGPHVKVSVSCGVAIFTPSDDQDRIFERADAALYAAKEAGRDILFFHDGSGPVAWRPLPQGSPTADCPSFDESGPPPWESDPEVQSLTLTLRAKLLERLGLWPRRENPGANHPAVAVRSD